MKKTASKRQLIGIVVSDKMEKTVVVTVERLVKHSLYQKYVSRRAKFAAHDEKSMCKTGDEVIITESRPLSKTKKWRVSQIVSKAV